ncbi:hypothetical protein [Chromatium okenii]|uniref:DUF7222 domain-containing protein n=1 Tax=Chromatium okenii TaxID=61644 RepID=UPI0026EDF7EC|nr:hypothetical protein [Chromatium okenii]MBV5308374.1 hypothetical protein [Chromatium okenii]
MNNDLYTAVCNQLGEDYQDDLTNVAAHGADGGFNGFIYFCDTLAFYLANRENIAALVDECAKEFDLCPICFVQSFKCCDEDTQTIARTLYGTDAQINENVANCLAWFALEQAAFSGENDD